MKSNYQKRTMMTCLLASSLSFNVFAQDATENQPLSPETEMAIMRVMNLENRIQTLQTVPVKMTDIESAGHKQTATRTFQVELIPDGVTKKIQCTGERFELKF